MTKYPKAIIFDLDGVITDTAEYHYQAWKQLAAELGITIDREFNERLKGVSRMDSLERILALKPELTLSQEEKERLATKKNEHYKELIKGITPGDLLPGIPELLAAIKEAGIPMGLASASKNAPTVIKSLGVEHYFAHVVDAAKVEKGKPDPEIFFKAADALGVPYEECIGVEDAPAGVEAINRAGMFSVGVGSKESLAHADYVVSTTSELVFENIIAQYNKR